MANFNSCDDVIYIADIAERIEALEERQTQPFCALWNVPGTLPEMEPEFFDDADDAKTFILDELKNLAAGSDTDGDANPYLAAVLELEADSAEEFSVLCAGLNFEVTDLGEFLTGSAEEKMELEALTELMLELRGAGGDEKWRGDWYPATLIRDSYFQDYARELAEERGLLPAEAEWPNNCIDWERAARELQHGFSMCDFDGLTFYFC